METEREYSEKLLGMLREELETAWLRGYRSREVDSIFGAEGTDENVSQQAAGYAERVVRGFTRPEEGERQTWEEKARFVRGILRKRAEIDRQGATECDLGPEGTTESAVCRGMAQANDEAAELVEAILSPAKADPPPAPSEDENGR